jgi:hypothetical protein
VSDRLGRRHREEHHEPSDAVPAEHPVATSIDISDLGTLKVAFDEAIAILNRK